MIKEAAAGYLEKGTSSKELEALIVARLLEIFQQIVPDKQELSSNKYVSPYITKLAWHLYFSAMRLSRKRTGLSFREVLKTSQVTPVFEGDEVSDEALFLNAAILKPIDEIKNDEVRALFRMRKLEEIKNQYSEEIMLLVFYELLFSRDTKYMFAYTALQQLQEELASAIDPVSKREKARKSR